MKKERIAGVLLSLVAVISLTGCGSSSDGVKTESSIDYNGNGDLYYEDDMYDGGEWTESERENSASVADNRKLIKTVDLTAETYEFDSLVTTVEQRVTSLGGYMESASIHTRYDDLKYGDFIIRIPVNKMEEFVTEFAEISNITDRSSTQKDVTLSYVDLESHKAALEAEETSLLTLLENAMSSEVTTATEKTEAQGILDKISTLSDNITVDYKIIHGADGSWTQSSALTLGFTADGAFSQFKEVRIADAQGNRTTLVRDTDYTAQSGSTIVTLKQSYLETLSVGEYKLEVVYDILGTEHIAECSFTVKAKPAPTPAPTATPEPTPTPAATKKPAQKVTAKPTATPEPTETPVEENKAETGTANEAETGDGQQDETETITPQTPAESTSFPILPVIIAVAAIAAVMIIIIILKKKKEDEE